MRLQRIIFTLTVAVFASTQALGGSIGFTQISPFMDWEPDCNLPYQPSFYVSDADSFNYAVEEFNIYVTEVENYVRCLRTEGETDLELLADAIAETIQQKRRHAVNSLDTARSDLEFQRSLLR